MTQLNFDESLGPVMVKNPYTGKETDINGIFLMVKQIYNNDVDNAIKGLRDVARVLSLYSDENNAPTEYVKSALLDVYTFSDAFESIRELKH
jgi:hypothetical protein